MNFLPGEVITYSVSTNTFDPMSEPYFRIFDEVTDANFVFHQGGLGNEINVFSASWTVPANLTHPVGIEAMAGWMSDTISVQMSCAAGPSTPAITANPVNVSIAAGANATFAATATSATGYQWQVNSGSGFTNLTNSAPYSGVTTTTLTVTGANANLNGYQYRMVASNGGATATSTAAALTVSSPPAIVAQPSASTICNGANTTFSVTAANATGYQWQVDQGAGFSNIANGVPYSGATTPILTITGATSGLNGYLYRAVAVGAASPSATSNAAALTVNSAPFLNWISWSSPIAAGGNTTFSMGATNATAYQWQVDTGSGFSNIANGAPYSGATTTTLTITGATVGMNGHRYRAIASGACSPSATSPPAELNVIGPPSFTAQPSNSAISVGANATFSVSAADATSYQWQVDTGSGFSNLTNGAPYSGVGTTTLTITNATAAMSGYRYRAVATGIASPAATSNAATLTVNKLDQTVSFTSTAPNDAISGGSYTPTASANSDLTPVITVNPASASFCSVAAGVVSFNAAGTCVIEAGQPGNDVYNPAPQALQFVMIAPAIPTVSLSATPARTILGTAITFSATVSGGVSPAGTVSFMNGGALLGSGTVTGGIASFSTSALVTGSHSVTAEYSGDASNTPVTSAAVPVTVDAPVVLSPVTGTTFAAGTVDFPYSATVSASGGSGSYTYGVVGAFPSGLSLDTATGAISGTPSSIWSSSSIVTITATDTANADNTASATYRMPVAGNYTLNDATVGEGYTSVRLATDQTATPSSGSIPPGMSITVTGARAVMEGTPTQAGSYVFWFANGTRYAITVLPAPAPTLSGITPSLGPAAGGTSVTLSGTNLATATAITFGGNNATGMTVNSATSITATAPAHAAGPADVVVSTAGGTATLASGYTYVEAPVANAVSATVPANSLANALTLNIDGTPDSVAIATAASHGTATVTGMAITYTPAAGYSGPDSFTYTATNAGGISAPATVTITVSPPVFTFTPAAGAWMGATVGTPYNGVTVTASNGTGPYTYAITAGTIPPGMSFTGGILAGTPSADGDYTFTVTATDANGAEDSVGYSLAVAPQVPIAADSSAAVTANSADTVIPLNLSGGTATSITIGTDVAHGTLGVNGTTVTYTPAPGYSGGDSFVYAAGNTTGMSMAATVTITVSAPTLSFTPAAGTLAKGTAGTAYSQAIAASGGASPYSYAVTSGMLPAGLDLDPASGEISGTPLAAGSSTFTVTATDANTAAGSATYTLQIDAGAALVTISPPAGALPAGTVGQLYAQQFTVTGSAGPYTFQIGRDHPPGMTLDRTTGLFSGTPATAYNFSSRVYVIDASNVTVASFDYTWLVNPPAAVVLTPVAGALPDGITGAAYNQTVAASGGTAPYAYAVTSGALPDGLSLDPATGDISGTPTVSGSFTLTVTATDANNATGSAAYTLAVTEGTNVPIASAVSSTVAANSSDNAIALDLGGDPADSVAIATQAAHGTATASGTAIAYTPAPGYSGPDSFTYTATNIAGTSAPATVTVTVTPPPAAITVSPAAGALPDGTTTFAYNRKLAASGGAEPYTYAVTAGALPAGLQLDPATGGISGRPAQAGSFAFTVTVTDANGATGTASLTITVTPATLFFSPFAGPLPDGVTGTAYYQTIIASGGTAPYAYAVAGGALPAGLSLDPATGEISGTPAETGSFHFDIGATDANGATDMVPYVLAVTQGLQAPVANPVSATIAANSSDNTVTLNLGGDTADSIAIAAQAEHGTASVSGMAVAYTPAKGYSGPDSFTYTATNAAGTSAPATVTITVTPPVVAFAFSPAPGSLGETMAGEAYSQQISATGGTAPLLYGIASGALPQGMVLNISTGELTGPSDGGSEGSYDFTVQVRDANGATGTAAYSLTVAPREVTVADRSVDVPPGSTPADVYLNRGATGGPFTSADLTFVEPAQAGTAAIIRGQLAQAGPVGTPAGWYLQFTPNPAFSGQARVGYRLTSALGISNTGTVTYNLRPDAQAVAEEVDSLVHGFVQTRQSMISSGIYVPGLMERRNMDGTADPVTLRMTPSEEGMTTSFSTSLAQMEAARDNADGIAGSATSPFNVWIDGAFMAHRRDDNDDRWGNFAMINLGADYLLTEKALIGLSFHYDRMTDPAKDGAELTGNGWLAGPYASLEIGRGVFWDTSLLYGGSANDIDTRFWDGSFDTTRWMIDTAIKGEWMLDEATVLTPKLRAVYFNEKVEAYEVKNGAGDEISIEGFDAEQFRVSLGAEIARSFTLESGARLTPKLGVTGGYSGLDGSGAFASLDVGVTLETVDFWMIDASLLLNVEAEGAKSLGGRLRAGKQF